MADPRSATGLLAIIFFAVSATFLATLGVVERSNRQVDAAAHSIGGNAVPSMLYLADARSALRRTDLTLEDYVNAPVAERPAIRARLDAQHTQLALALARYFALPPFTGEPALEHEIEACVRNLDDAKAGVLALADSTGRDAALRAFHEDFRSRVNTCADEIAATIRFDAKQVDAFILQIEQHRRAAKRQLFELALLSALLAAAGAVSAIFWVRRYGRLQREHTLLIERRADELEQFSARVAHDVRSPLGAVRLMLQRLEREPPPGDVSGVASRARGTLDRTFAIVDALYDFARAGTRPERAESTEIREIVEGVVRDAREAAERFGAQVLVGAIPATRVACAPGILAVLLSNLLQNAVTHIDRKTGERRIDLRITDGGATCRFEVADTGPGIAPEHQAVIFQPYVRVGGGQSVGLGLGLATVKRFVEAHGGQVGLRSQPAVGSTFWFELPVAAHPASGTRAHPEN
jgi:signal transduction histidine kinase